MKKELEQIAWKWQFDNIKDQNNNENDNDEMRMIPNIIKSLSIGTAGWT